MDSYENPLPGRNYISPSLKSYDDPSRKIRIATKLIESPDSYAFAKLRDETVIRHKPNAASKITAKFFEDDRNLFVLSIQGYTVATEKPRNASFTFIGDEIDKLIEFIHNIQRAKFERTGYQNISDEELRKITLTDAQAVSLFEENKELFYEILGSNITTEDVVAIGYRRDQVRLYEKLLNDEVFFREYSKRESLGTEAVWQRFFEKNEWVFGYGLGYLFLSSLEGKKLEQVVRGFSVASRGKRVDALMKTKGIISSLSFVEIKTSSTPLLDAKPYRSSCWAPSKELAGAVSQVQGTVHAAMKTLSERIKPTDENGDPTGEDIFNIQPKSYLVIGNLSEFQAEHGLNEEKFSSFELFRKNTKNPEILTFDELYERAKFIVLQNEC